MKSTRNIIWRMNERSHKFCKNYYHVYVYLLPYEHYEAHVNAKVESLPSKMSIVLWQTNVVYNHVPRFTQAACLPM
jgi:hypothetical protein